MDNDNRRMNSRVAFQATISLDFGHRSHKDCETSNLSLKGVSVVGVMGHKVGEKCDVALHLVGTTSDLSLNMKGEVVRVDEHGFALHFLEIDLDSFYHLKNILYYNSENPDQLDEEFSSLIVKYQSEKKSRES